MRQNSLNQITYDADTEIKPGQPQFWIYTPSRLASSDGNLLMKVIYASEQHSEPMELQTNSEY